MCERFNFNLSFLFSPLDFDFTANKLDSSLYTCLTQLYGVIDMYNLLHKEQLHVSALLQLMLPQYKSEAPQTTYSSTAKPQLREQQAARRNVCVCHCDPSYLPF